MQINSQIYLNKFSLNIPSTSETGLKFSQGEILKGLVQELKENGLISINLKGKIIDAISTVEVNKGQQLFLIVDEIKDGKAILKILNDETLNKMDNNNLSNTLKDMSLPDNDKNLQLAKKLIQHNLPITSENIKTISKGVNLLDGVTPKNLELVGLAMAKDVPITPQVIKSLVQFLEDKYNLASLSKETVKLLNQIKSEMTAVIESKTTPATSNQSRLSYDVFQLLDKLLETITIAVDQSSKPDLANEIMESIKTNLVNENDLVRGLDLAKDILEQKETPGVSKKSTDLLINKLDVMGKELAGQKIPNVMSRFSTDSDLDFYYLSFPVKFEDQYRLSQIKISKNSGKESLADMDNIRFAVSLDTSNLGLVLFNVEWHKSASLKIEGIVENQTALKYIETNFNKLIKDLESHNYLVDYKGITVSTNANQDMRLKLKEKPEIENPLQVDIWV